MVNGNIQDICPVGWHVPSDGEWNTMENALVSATDINTTSINVYQGNSTDFAAILSGGCDWTDDGGTDKNAE